MVLCETLMLTNYVTLANSSDYTVTANSLTRLARLDLVDLDLKNHYRYVC